MVMSGSLLSSSIDSFHGRPSVCPVTRYQHQGQRIVWRLWLPAPRVSLRLSLNIHNMLVSAPESSGGVSLVVGFGLFRNTKDNETPKIIFKWKDCGSCYHSNISKLPKGTQNYLMPPKWMKNGCAFAVYIPTISWQCIKPGRILPARKPGRINF